MQRLLIVIATLALLVTSSGTTARAASTAKIYDSLEIAPNIVSEGPEAYAFTELGDLVTFAGTARRLDRVTVTLSSWACQAGHWFDATCVTAPGATFSLPITFNIYQPGANDRAGALITTKTQTFAVPYRPSTDATNCTGGKWFDAATAKCFNGLETFVTFDFHTQGLVLPNTVVYGITYSTTHFGTNPIGAAACTTSSGGCFYDSLNIGLASKVNVGAQVHPGTIYQNATVGSQYCDNGAAGINVMRLDSPSAACWTNLVPAVSFTARRAENEDEEEDEHDGDHHGDHHDGDHDDD